MPYKIVDVPPDDFLQFEQLGTKAKFWFSSEDQLPVLFKEGRLGTGENWSEKICAEIAEALGLPHAHYDLAHCGDRRGVVTPSIVPRDGRLVHGNELLARVFKQYKPEATYKDRQHTLGVVVAVLANPIVLTPHSWECPTELRNAFSVFVGYLLLDALVGNQDRHHQNWGLIFQSGIGLSLAPTFDHASSLGRNETDAVRIERLHTADRQRSVSWYVTKARSALFDTQGSTRAMSTLQALEEGARIDSEAAAYWKGRLEGLLPDKVNEMLELVPAEWISEPAKQFAAEVVRCNRIRILESI